MATPTNNPSSKEIGKSFKGFLNTVWGFFDDLTDLQEGMDRKGTIQNIKNNKKMKGANAWLLMCSIMIASLGLDLNSPAVIIGAMLISPLMSPILGVGLGIGINDKETLYISLQHFGIAIGIALFTSTFYFYFTPFGQETNEILSRTKPGTLDALVAFFGGIAGIISGSRIDKSNAIPGVAIATALMPPLCVTGFGMANGNIEIIFNSFYLFFLNATLVALATFLIVRLLRFPMKQYESAQERRKMLLIVFTFSIIVTLPSLYILNQVWQEFNFKQKAEAFLNDYCGEENMEYIDSWKVVQLDTINRIAVKVYGSRAKFFDKEKMENGLKDFNLDNTVIDIIKTTEVDLEKYEKLESEVYGFKNIAEQLEAAKTSLNDDELLINKLQAQIDSIHADTLPYQQIYGELRAAFPNINQVAFAQTKESNFQKTADMPILLLNWDRKTTTSTMRKEEPRVLDFVKVRIGLDTLKVIRY